MIIPYTWNLTVYVGTDFVDAIVFTQGGEPVNLTNYTAYDQIRDEQAQGGTLIAEFDCAITAAEGKVTLSLTDAETAAIAVATGYHTLVLRDPDGVDLPFAMGQVTFEGTSTVVPAEA